MKTRWTFDEAVDVYRDLLTLEEDGHWKDGHPEWAKTLITELDIDHSLNVALLLCAWKEVAIRFAQTALNPKYDGDLPPYPAAFFCDSSGNV